MIDATAPLEGASHTDTRGLIDWLAGIIARHDLGLRPPDDERAVILGELLGAVSREFADYRDVVAGAREAARVNVAQLGDVVRSAGEQGSLVRATAVAATQAGDGATLVLDAAEALAAFTAAASGAVGEAGQHLGRIDAALDELGARLAEGDRPLGDMRSSTRGVAAFLVTLARLSRHAQLLAVNASIEAAHLAEGGSRFGIVAQEVRKLSVSTRESKADVAHIVGELRESTDRVAVATADSKEATRAAETGIAGAGEALSRTGIGIDTFAKLVGEVADVAGTQSMALMAISSSIDQISHHADEAALASRDAARLDLDALIERAHAKAVSWTLMTLPVHGKYVDSTFARWISAIVDGNDPAERAEVDNEPELGSLVAAVRGLIESIDGEQRGVLANVVEVAVAVSRNGYAWRSIGDSLDGVSREINVVRETVGESAAGARTAAELAAGMRGLVESIRSQSDAALKLLEGALARITRIAGSVKDIDGFVEAMSAAAARADQIMALIETLSSETDLLSLNAAIEAAHAGELGLGFSVIAEEIRSLARATNDSTVEVTQLVSKITHISGDLQGSIGAAAASMDHVIASAEGVRSAIATLRTSFESAAARAIDVSTSASEQSRALDRVLENINRSATDANVAGATDRSRLELAMVGSRAHGIAARRPIGTVVSRVRELAENLCVKLEGTLDAALSGGRVSPEALFNLTYRPIAGGDIARLARLFDVSRVPADGFVPGKFATPWDAAIDEAMIDVVSDGWAEAVASGFLPVTIFVSDLNGFFYAYPRQKIAAWTNDPAADAAGNRIKRLFEDEYALRVGRYGLGPQAASLGPRCTYERFRAAGCDLGRAATRPWGGYVYARDTSMVCNEVVMAIYAGDQRHSTLRICYDPTLI